MILRLSQKLGKKLGYQPTEALPLETNPYVDWSGHLFRADRVQYIILSNTASLYSVFMYGRGITNDSLFIKEAMSILSETLHDDGFEFIAKRLVTPAAARVSLSKPLNRSVTGSMNNLIMMAQCYLEDEDISPYDLSFKLNGVIMSYIHYDSPREAFSRLLLQPGPPP